MEPCDKVKFSKSIECFDYLDKLIHSGAKEIALDFDITLSDGEESKYSDGIDLNIDDLLIDGRGHVIDARGLTRIFNCSAKNITIRNITLRNGFAQEYGGAIYNFMGKLMISEVIIAESTSRYGGAIYNDEGEICIMESTLKQNLASSMGVQYTITKAILA